MALADRTTARIGRPVLAVRTANLISTKGWREILASIVEIQQVWIWRVASGSIYRGGHRRRYRGLNRSSSRRSRSFASHWRIFRITEQWLFSHETCVRRPSKIGVRFLGAFIDLILERCEFYIVNFHLWIIKVRFTSPSVREPYTDPEPACIERDMFTIRAEMLVIEVEINPSVWFISVPIEAPSMELAVVHVTVKLRVIDRVQRIYLANPCVHQCLIESNVGMGSSWSSRKFDVNFMIDDRNSVIIIVFVVIESPNCRANSKFFSNFHSYLIRTCTKIVSCGNSSTSPYSRRYPQTSTWQ